MNHAFADPNHSLVELADQAMSRGEVAKAASLLEVAAQRGRDASTLLRLATVRRALGDVSAAAAAAAAAVELAPRNFLMALLLGSLREATGSLHAASRAYRTALQHVPIELGLQPVLERQVKHARAVVEAESAWRERLLQWDFGACTHLRPMERRRMQGFRANILESLEAGPLTPPMFMIPGLTGPNYLNADEFVGAAAVAAETAAIRAEFLNLIEAHGEFASHMRGLHEGDQSSASTGRWSMVPLIRDGQPVEKFAAACPRTMAAAARFEQPKLGAISPSLYFSVLEPGSSIAPHRGITNGRVIGHWPLIVPEDCAFRVGGETRPWKVGEPLIFDDMITHEAWNRNDQIRVVLIADLWRPELGPAERSTVTDLLDVDLAVG